MKPNIHPKYYDNCQVTCSCGNTFITSSTRPEIKTEICSACHPFFTGEMKFVDSEGRVEKFKQRQTKAGQVHIKKKQKKLLKRKEAERKEAERPKTLKEMLQKKS